MLRRIAIAATVLTIGCPSEVRPPRPPGGFVDDSALRIRIAHAEVKREGGVDELIELATRGDVHERELAVIGLGRIGSPKAVAALIAIVGDRSKPTVVTRALGALGLAAALDDTAPLEGLATPELLVDPMAVEAFGRGGGVRDEAALVAAGAHDPEHVALALGRLGRRKLALTPSARAWLVATTTSTSAVARYAATYALSREHEPPVDDAATAALAARVGDDDPETRAVAIAGLVKRKAIAIARKDIADSLRDRDWRVAVEAVRALAGDQGDEAGRAQVQRELGAQLTALEHGNEAAAHVVIEALQLLAKHDQHAPEVVERARHLGTPLARAWIINSAGTDDPSLPDHLRLPLAAKPQRAVVRVLLEHRDARVRAAALPLLAQLWKDGDANDHRATINAFVAALASPDPIIAGSAVDAAEALYDAIGSDDHRALDQELVDRAIHEQDAELGASLFELIGKRAIPNGATACRAGLGGHVIRARAALACLRALGEAMPEPERAPPVAPPVDVATVIGKRVTWHLVTTRGEIVIELDPDIAPWNVATIVALTTKGFYDGLEFHRVVGNFVVQGGDPTMSGWGGPGYTTPAEPGFVPRSFGTGAVGIADAGRDSGGSQFFIMHSRAPHLEGRYTWIGQVTKGQNYADALLIGDKIEKATVWVETRTR